MELAKLEQLTQLLDELKEVEKDLAQLHIIATKLIRGGYGISC